MDPIQRAILRADPRLSKFDPLPRILFFDNFNDGMSGWNVLLGNYTESLDRRLPEYKLMTTPMLSNVTHWDGGTHGALDGSYAMKIATRPIRLAQTVALKRLTFPKACPIQLECYFTFKPEASELKLSELAARLFADEPLPRLRESAGKRALAVLESRLAEGKAELPAMVDRVLQSFLAELGPAWVKDARLDAKRIMVLPVTGQLPV